METITLHGREFTLGEPNALHIVRLLAVVGRVGTRAERVAAEFGAQLLQAAQGEAGTSARLPAGIFPFLAALTADDMLELMAALLQFDNETEGTRWLSKHPPTLNDVIQVIGITLRHTQGITEAIGNFTTLVGGMNLAALLGSPTETPPPAAVAG